MFDSAAKSKRNCSHMADATYSVDRLKDMAEVKTPEKIREILPTCFRGEALIWHSTELTELEKILLRTAPLSA